ncbi:MAG: insulinase family protein [Ignavibacterium album]|uniref:M16 family metallopeptidase n=1 Tax=Ignavibacterium album TaxID=591197 RepID=UPI0026EE2F2B|nr:pitrilysin family protein [Ignavibacterium album]MCX8104386.1 insulinase family protein [Ignavibacterium album]
MNNSIKKSLNHSILILLTLSSIGFAQFKLPHYEVYELKNGLTIYLMEKKDVPLISVAMAFDAGSVKNGKDYALAAFTAEALKFGTINYTKSQIDSIFNFYGSNLSVSATYDYSSLFTQIMKENFEILLPVISEVVTKPQFPADEVDKRKQRWIVELDQAKESPRRVIGDYFNRLIFNDGIYSNPVRGTKESVQKISDEKIREFYSSFYRPETSVIAIVGDFETAKVKSLLESYFGNWKNSSPKIISDIRFAAKTFEEPRVYLINKENAFETTFMIGGYGIPMSNPDLIQIDVINTILGGRFTSWLNDELRVNAGLTYGARSRFSSYKHSGTFFFTSFTTTKNTEAALELALKTYNRLFEKGIDEATLKSAKNYVKGQFPPDYETSNSLASFLIQKYFFGLDDSYINDFEKMVDDLDVKKANEIVKKYFPKENLQFVLIGKADSIRDIAKKYGKVIERNLSEDGF